ncbi:TetR/AcrR family transcriptional regulator [Nocardioides sp.]|uniref:TetR/AcrR family transcriptional regulator n=1 Tax=Nocardioides sp. TaxID=35761 RepID=UPI003515D869
MAKSVGKLVPKVPKVPTVSGVAAATRRASYSASTKRSLLDAATALFTEHGYAGTSLDQIVAAAAVTKGALYHHYSGKQALFEAVFERIETEAAQRIAKALKKRRDPWDKALGGVRAFLEVVREPSYRRVVIQDGPAVLGYERFREQEGRSTFAHVVEIIDAVLDAGDWSLDEQMRLTFGRIFFGAMSSAGETVSSAEDPELEARRVEAAVGFMFSGFQLLIGTSETLPDALRIEAVPADPDDGTDGASDDT